MRKAAKILLINLVVLAALLVLLEGAFRVVRYVLKGPESERIEIANDPKYGWVLNTEFKGLEKTNGCGEPVTRGPLTDRFFIRNDEGGAGSRRILFVGDSFTHGHEVSTGQVYYDYMLAALAPEYVGTVMGVGGYGTSQQSMMLQETYAEIRPDIVIWQFCDNDVNDNRYVLDNASFFNMQRRRPYLDLERSTYVVRNPGFFLFDVSEAFNWAFIKLLIIDQAYQLGILSALDRMIALDEGVRQAETEKSYLVIDREFEKLRHVHDGPVIAFNACVASDADRQAEFEDALARIAAKHDVHYFKNFGAEIASQPNARCELEDIHWNHLGNRLAADKLLQYFRQTLEGR